MREMGAWELGQALESTLLPQLRRKPYRQSPGESTQQGLIWGEVCGQNEMGRQGAVTRRCCEVKASKQQEGPRCAGTQLCGDPAVWGSSCAETQLGGPGVWGPSWGKGGARRVETQLGWPRCAGPQVCGDPAGEPRCAGRLPPAGFISASSTPWGLCRDCHD